MVTKSYYLCKICSEVENVTLLKPYSDSLHNLYVVVVVDSLAEHTYLYDLQRKVMCSVTLSSILDVVDNMYEVSKDIFMEFRDSELLIRELSK